MENYGNYHRLDLDGTITRGQVQRAADGALADLEAAIDAAVEEYNDSIQDGLTDEEIEEVELISFDDLGRDYTAFMCSHPELVTAEIRELEQETEDLTALANYLESAMDFPGGAREEDDLVIGDEVEEILFDSYCEAEEVKPSVRGFLNREQVVDYMMNRPHVHRVMVGGEAYFYIER